jgi:hypothetical protein
VFEQGLNLGPGEHGMQSQRFIEQPSTVLGQSTLPEAVSDLLGLGLHRGG